MEDCIDIFDKRICDIIMNVNDYINGQDEILKDDPQLIIFENQIKILLKEKRESVNRYIDKLNEFKL